MLANNFDPDIYILCKFLSFHLRPIFEVLNYSFLICTIIFKLKINNQCLSRRICDVGVMQYNKNVHFIVRNTFQNKIIRRDKFLGYKNTGVIQRAIQNETRWNYRLITRRRVNSRWQATGSWNRAISPWSRKGSPGRRKIQVAPAITIVSRCIYSVDGLFDPLAGHEQGLKVYGPVLRSPSREGTLNLAPRSVQQWIRWSTLNDPLQS